MSDEPQIRELTLADHPQLLELMRRTPGMCVRNADLLEPTRRYLERNPGMSFVAVVGPRLVGCAMAGHDGRRGYLQHVFTEPDYRGRGLAQALVSRCLTRLSEAGIEKVHLEVLKDNELGNHFWARRGWVLREDIARYSLVLTSDSNA